MNETQRLIRYITIGIFTTLVTWIIWSTLFKFSQNTNFDSNIRLSASQFIASCSTIPLSFYINRKVTFKDKKRRYESKKYTVLNVFALYLVSPAIASMLTYLIQLLLPGLLPIEILKLIGLGAGMLLNYSGQKLWIYKTS